MTHEEAKFILQSYRPDGSDAGDESFAAALKLAQEDAALGRWFERQQSFDRAIAAKLREIQAPAELRAAILAGGPARGRARAPWWQQPRWLAMAAGIVVLLSAALLLRSGRAQDRTSFLAFVVNDARHSETHGGSGEPTGELQARLNQPTTRLGGALATNFENLRATGCRTVSFKGRDVLEVCFNRNGEWFHCYIVRQADFPSMPSLAEPVISQLDQVDVATWSDSSHVYMVVSKVGLDALQRLL
jgi:hypothetical protein